MSPETPRVGSLMNGDISSTLRTKLHIGPGILWIWRVSAKAAASNLGSKLYVSPEVLGG